jgi:hypothetical protein
MRLPVSIMTSLALVTVLGAPTSQAQQRCPDVESAKVALKAAPATRQPLAARSQDVQAPRNQDVQAPRNQDIQAPRNQDVQAPRGQQDVQAPRNQDVQAPRGQQDVQAPRNQDIQAPRGQAAQLVKEAEAACNSGNTALASEKARAAMSLLNR